MQVGLWRDCPCLRMAVRALLLLVSLGALLMPATYAQSQPEADVVIDQLHLFLFPAEETLTISEYYLLGNMGDTVYTGVSEGSEEGITIVFPLPAGAAEIRIDETVDDPDRYRLGASSIADTRPISPGVATVEARFAYDLPLVPGETISRTVPLDVRSLVILLVGEAWRLEGPGLTSLGPMEAGGQTAVAYESDPIGAGEVMAFRIVAGSPASAAPGDGTGSQSILAPSGRVNGIEIAVGVAAVLAAALAAAMLWRSQPLPPVPESAREEVATMAELDVRYASGEMSETTYREERRALRAQLRDRIRSGGGGDGR